MLESSLKRIEIRLTEQIHNSLDSRLKTETGKGVGDAY